MTYSLSYFSISSPCIQALFSGENGEINDLGRREQPWAKGKVLGMFHIEGDGNFEKQTHNVVMTHRYLCPFSIESAYYLLPYYSSRYHHQGLENDCHQSSFAPSQSSTILLSVLQSILQLVCLERSYRFLVILWEILGIFVKISHNFKIK